MALTVASGGSLIIEPSEDWDLAFTYVGKLPAGQSVSTAEMFASEMVSTLLTTTLAAAGVVDANTISLAANVGAGAKLTLEARTSVEETVKVFALTGAGPFTATIVPALRAAHAQGAAVSYEPGQSGIVIEQATGFVAADVATVHIRRVIHGRCYRVSCRVTTSGGRHLEDSVILIGQDL